jgi:cytoskeletal protein CcmA (bactofilin family)
MQGSPMFNKRDNPHPQEETTTTPEPVRRSAPSSGGQALIGASIHVDGTLRGEEDLLIEGKVKGTVELKKNSVTIGAKGEVNADVYAHTIVVEGRMEGQLIAAERVVIRKSAQIRGSVVAPRVSLEDGARFNGTIDMDPESEVLKKAFSGRASSPSPAPGPRNGAASAEKRPEASA